MLTGELVGGALVAYADGTGKPIVETAAPEAPEGYEMRACWRDDGSRIVQAWEAVPAESSVDDAVRRLARMQAESLGDEQALEVAALFPEWKVGQSYAVGDRVRFSGTLYRCLQAHTALAEWEPTSAPSLWAEVLPGQDGNEPDDGYAEWTQPGSTNGYSTGDRVTHGGHLWESLVDSNVDEPGTDNGFRWKDLGAWPAEEVE